MLRSLQLIIACTAKKMGRKGFENLCQEVRDDHNASVTLEEVVAKCVIGRPYEVLAAYIEDNRDRRPGRKTRNLYLVKEFAEKKGTSTAFLLATSSSLSSPFVFDGRDVVLYVGQKVQERPWEPRDLRLVHPSRPLLLPAPQATVPAPEQILAVAAS